jgi:hypothetical protein
MSSCVVYFDARANAEGIIYIHSELSFVSNDTDFLSGERVFVFTEMNKSQVEQYIFNSNGVSTSTKWKNSVWRETNIFQDEINRVIDMINSSYRVVFTFGKVRAAFLKTLFKRHIVDLEDLGCSSPSVMKTAENLLFSHHIAYLLTTWCRSNRQLTDFLNFETRLKTLKNFPNTSVNITDLAKTGMYYTFSKDNVVCLYCNKIFHSWLEGDVPAEDHRYWSIYCPLMRGIPEVELRDFVTERD